MSHLPRGLSFQKRMLDALLKFQHLVVFAVLIHSIVCAIVVGLDEDCLKVMIFKISLEYGDVWYLFLQGHTNVVK